MVGCIDNVILWDCDFWEVVMIPERQTLRRTKYIILEDSESMYLSREWLIR